MQLRYSQRGDTIIEVMLAFTVFAMLAVGAIAIMNQGVASAQDALETTLVREQIDGQAETLRFMHQAYMADPTTAGPAQTFKGFVDNAQAENPTPFGQDASCLQTIPQGTQASFAVDPRSGTKLTTLQPMSNPNAPPYAKLNYPATPGLPVPYGLWVEAVKGGQDGQPAFIDFHIRACWYSVTSSVPRTLGTIVRLYVPA